MHNSRRLRILMLSGLMFSLLLMAGGARPLHAQVGTPALVNPSFESGVVNWTTQATCNYTTFASTVNFPSQHGSIFMGANRNNSATCTSIYQDVAFSNQIGATYRFAIWVRSAVAAPRAGTLSIVAFGSTLAETASANFSAASGLWQCAEVSLRTMTAHTAMRFQLGLTTLTAGDFHFDNAQTEQNPTTPICPQVGEGSTRQQLFVNAYSRNGGAAAQGTPTDIARLTGSMGTQARSQQLSGGAVIYHDELRDSPFQGIPAYVLPEPFLSGFRGLPWLGASPTSDRFTNADGNLQVNFPAGYMYRDGTQTLASSWPISTTGQWYAEYHNGSNFNGGPTWVQNEPGPDMENFWGEAAPGAGKWGVWADNFVVRWTGRFNFAEGDYRFLGAADDSLRVWVDGELILISNLNEVASVRWMSAGLHTIRVEMVEIGGGANMFFEWAAAPGCNLLVNNGQVYTNQRQVSIRTGAAGAAEQQLSNDPSFPGAVWQPYQLPAPWTLADPGAQVAELAVYGRYRTAQGGAPCAPDASETDAIVYDPLPPSLSAYSNSPILASVIYSTAADQPGGSGVSEMQVSSNPAFTNATWRPYDPQVSVSGGLFTTWYVRVRDNAGNVSRTVVTGYKLRIFVPLVGRQ